MGVSSIVIREGSYATLRAPLPLQLEMILQAHEYEGAQGMVLQEFFDSTAGKWRTDVGKAWAEEIYQRRREAEKKTEGSEVK